MYLLGIDGGQTSTKSCLYDQETGVCLLASGPPIDHMLTLNGQIKSKQGIQLSLQKLLEQAALIKTVEMAFVSISGVHKEHEEMIKSWIQECIHVDRFLVEGDVKANLAGASAGKNDGVLIIAGGGSIGYCFNGENEFVAGGYGHILGDEGSAYWIGLQAIKSGIHYSDGRGPFTVLHDRILDQFRETSFWGVKKQLHADKIQRSDIADLAMLVERAAGEGDAVAQSILRQAGAELGQLAISVLRQIAEQPGASAVRKVYPTGGVFQSTNWVRRSLTEVLHVYDPSLEVCTPSYSPVIGTLILSAQALGRTIQLGNVEEAVKGGHAS
ncbi:N-acetylglucosamine kinase [Paenibacillus sp. MBLB4367]|uniref:N-acetylglucosamine kinase n=1 Tax=Paenibacillus sp. MBLB4367 TaxID=3384767 RepID=UPI003908285A